MTSLKSTSKFTGRGLAAVAALGAIGVMASSLPTAASAAGGLGYTWAKIRHESQFGIDVIGSGTHDPFVGNRSCTARLPVLCVKLDGSPRPNYAIDAVDQGLPKEGYRGWLEGHVSTSRPVKGSSLGSPADGDAACVSDLGPGWRMAEFHDGKFLRGMDETHLGNSIGSLSTWPVGPKGTGGFAFVGYGNVRTDKEYWVNINDTNGNCWNP